jgi:hypothetical protein
MPLPDNAQEIAQDFVESLSTSSTGRKRLKVKTLMKKFGFKRRTEENTAEITELFKERDVLISPSIMKFGDDWELSFEDWVRLTLASADVDDDTTPSGTVLPEGWNADGWFDAAINKRLRTEKEVETKFVIPLLGKLGFNEDDRYDAMPVSASFGSKPTTLRVDCALFNEAYESLKGQVLLTVEAKKEERLSKPVELKNARNQAKSYALWTGCYYSMITDSRQIEVYKLARTHTEDDRLLFSCSRTELKEKFGTLYAAVSKEVLTAYYLEKLGGSEELT